MPGSSVAIGAGRFTEAPAAAAGDTEIRFEPGTRVVVDEALPTSDDGVNAQWYRTVTSRSSAAGVTTEIAEVKCYINLAGAASGAAVYTVIGVDGEPSSLGDGSFIADAVGATMLCLETPAGGEPVIALNTSLTGSTQGAFYGLSELSRGNWVAGDVARIDTDAIRVLVEDKGVGDLVLITGSNPSAAGTYSAGKFLLTFICRYAVPS